MGGVVDPIRPAAQLQDAVVGQVGEGAGDVARGTQDGVAAACGGRVADGYVQACPAQVYGARGRHLVVACTGRAAVQPCPEG